ncbi:MAG: NAD(P)-binding domain-containing protein, partial [Solirubrobacterales bacterium]|nr:NAD(P)-binding domain-containing protein [Solirubrobacterales bacterium]
MTRVAFIGLGNMGGPMCGHLAAAGFSVSAFDLDPAALARAVDAGARRASDLDDCVRGAEILITMLPAPPQVEQVLLGDSGAIAAMDRGSLAIDM